MAESGLEQELKLVAPSAAVLDKVLQSELVTALLDPDSDTPDDPQRFRGIYYDTVDGALGRQHCSLRAREEGDKLVAAFKLAGVIENGLSTRMEYETPIDGPFNIADELPESELKQNVMRVISCNAPLLETVVVDMQRRIRDLVVPGADGCQIELVADSGTIYGGRRSEALFEIELELKSGGIEPMLDLGKRLMKQFDLRHSIRTKHQIGMALRARANATGQHASG